MTGTETPKERIRRLQSVEEVDADSNGISLTFGTSLTFVGAETYEDIVAILWRDMQWALRVCEAAAEAYESGLLETTDNEPSWRPVGGEDVARRLSEEWWRKQNAARALQAAIEDTEGGAQ